MVGSFLTLPAGSRQGRTLYSVVNLAGPPCTYRNIQIFRDFSQWVRTPVCVSVCACGTATKALGLLQSLLVFSRTAIFGTSPPPSTGSHRTHTGVKAAMATASSPLAPSRPVRGRSSRRLKCRMSMLTAEAGAAKTTSRRSDVAVPCKERTASLELLPPQPLCAPASSSVAGVSRSRPKRRHRPKVGASVCGRTQYALHASASHHACVVMKSGLPAASKQAHDNEIQPQPGDVGARKQGTCSIDKLLAPFALSAASSASRVRPVWVEGMGRILVPCSQQFPAPPDTQAPHMALSLMPSPPQDARQLQQRHALVAQWLARDDDGDDDDSDDNNNKVTSEIAHDGVKHNTVHTDNAPDPPSAAYAPARILHPMMAKCLRERSRGQPYPKRASAHFDDMWIGFDGARVLRGTKQTAQRRRRIASTMYALTISGSTPRMACRCGFTELHMEVVQCDACARWLHLACVGVRHVDELPMHEWVCDDCYNERAVIAHSPSAPVSQNRRIRSPMHGHPTHDGLHAHAKLRSSTLSLAPSPILSLDDTLDSVLPVMQPPEAPRTPSPSPRPAALVDMVTPSRHFAPSTQPEWLSTPSSFLAQSSPCSMLGAPNARSAQNHMWAPESPTFATHGAARHAATSYWRGATTPSDVAATPSFPSDPFSDGLGLSSPMPETPPSGSTRGRMLGMLFPPPSPIPVSTSCMPAPPAMPTPMPASMCAPIAPLPPTPSKDQPSASLMPPPVS